MKTQTPERSGFWVVRARTLAMALVGALGLFLAGAAGTAGPLEAATLTVDQNQGKIEVGDPCPKPRDKRKFREIQAAVNCAIRGDTIKIRPGAYDERIFVRKKLTIRGSGTDRTSVTRGFDVGVDSEKVVRIFDMTLAAGEIPTAQDGCLLENQSGRLYVQRVLFSVGAGKSCALRGAVVNNDYMEIKNCEFAGNTVWNQGSAIDNQGTMDILDTAIVNNVSENDLGAIFNEGDMLIRRGLVSGNTGGGIVNQGTLDLFNTLVELNTPFDCFGCL